jgi:simple sugar transport system ATP-binding protein
LINLIALDLARLSWRLHLNAERPRSARLLERFDVRPRDLDLPAANLSGGNLQKLVLARELAAEPALIVVCFPTLGLDLAATRALLAELVAQAERGAAVIWIGEDLDQLLEHAHQIAVMHRGQLRGPVPTGCADRQRLGLWMTGAEA